MQARTHAARAATGPEQLIISKVSGPQRQMSKNKKTPKVAALCHPLTSVFRNPQLRDGLFYKSMDRKSGDWGKIFNGGFIK